MKTLPLFAVLSVAVAVPAFAQPVVNGTRAGDSYGSPAAVQQVETQFGDNASELNAAYCTFSGDRFYLMLTGNLESNFNKLEIFIDSRPGGENVLSGIPGNDGTGFKFPGFTFDAGFEADYHIIVRNGFSPGPRFDLDYAQLGTGNVAFYPDIFAGSLTGSGATGVGPNTQPIKVGFDNSNVNGVLGGTGAAIPGAAAAVETGIELSIALADLGFLGGEIKVCAFVNGSNHDYVSNQFLGALNPPQGNLGGDGNGGFTGTIGAINLNNFLGQQYFRCAGQPVPATSATWGSIKSIYR